MSKHSKVQYYVVQPGDTLRSLAKEYYGSETRYTDLYHLNGEAIYADLHRRGVQHDDERWHNHISPGMRILVPRKNAASRVQT